MQRKRKNFGFLRDASGPTVPAAIEQYAFRTDDGLTFLKPKGDPSFHSYADVYAEMKKRGKHFLDLGLKKGDRAAFIIPDPEDFVLTFFGAMSVGVVPVPMYPPLSFGKLDAYIDASAKIIAASGARVLVTDKKVQNILWSLIDDVKSLEDIHVVEQFWEDNDGDIPPLDQLTHEDVAFLQYTSGSTSLPKGVIVTHGSLLANLDGIMNVGLRIDDDDIAVSWLPLYHDMGLIGFTLAPIWYGVPTVYMPPTMFIKRPSRWMQTMSDYGASIAFAPNFAFALAAKRTKPEIVEQMDLSKVKALGCGAEPNHPGTLNAFLDHFAPAGLQRKSLLPCYGMAEATLAIAFIDLEEELTADRVDAETYQTDKIAAPAAEDDENALEFVSCGRPFPNHNVLVVDTDGNELPERHVGQLVVQGPSVTPGYFEEPEKTALTFKELGLMTGDLGYIADGEVYVTGRMKDVIILNGRNYDPQSIEWVVQDIDGIRKGNVVAFSIPGERTEELVIVAETKADVDKEALSKIVATAVREALAVSAGDVALVGRGELPKTSSGKLQRAKTREQYMSGELGVEGARTHDARTQKTKLVKHVAKSAVVRAKHEVKSTVKSKAGGLLNKIAGKG